MKKYNSIVELQNDYLELEKKHFVIIDSYVIGMVTKEEIKDFENFYTEMREAVYEMETNEENIREIARIKSILQHYYTEILEDEELLTMAYSNS